MIDQYDLYAYMRNNKYPTQVIEFVEELIDKYVEDMF